MSKTGTASMRSVLVACLAAALPVAHAHADSKRTTFVVIRNGEQIGTNTIAVARDGSQTTVDITTHIRVTLAFLTLYRFDQTETEQWSGRQLLSLRTRTDDNGKVHRTIAGKTGDVLAIRRDDEDTKTSATVIPLDLWNPAVLAQSMVLIPLDGSVVPVRTIDHGEENFSYRGRAMRAHHYTIAATFSQDVWYDTNGELVGVRLTGSDGSIIRYELS